jgi:small-conductance mechanosensitive channel
MRKTLWLLLAFTLASFGFFYLRMKGHPLATMADGKTLADFLGWVFAVAAGYEACILLIAAAVRLRKGAPSEVAMLGSLMRGVAAVVVIVILLHFLGQLKGLTALAAFSGLLLGWSLQAPVSGIAAWAFVNLKRPFRVGDRILLPAWGLTGDVTQIGMMYTVLNQVGGSIGGEEAVGRYVLIPNAMLFGNIVINYTPQQAAAYMLDEVVVRITFNSNWERTEKILLDAARAVTGHIAKETGQEPYIRADMYDYGVYMRLRYMTLATDRPRIVYEITKRIFAEFQKYPDIDFAIPYVYSYRTGRRAGARHLEPPRDVGTVTAEVNITEVHDPTGVGSKPENAEQVRKLATEIAERGLLQPIVVEKRPDGQYNVVAGHLRLAACKMLGWESVPAVVKSPSDSPSS